MADWDDDYYEDDGDTDFDPEDFDSDDITDFDQLWEFAYDEDLYEYEFHATGDTGAGAE